MTSDLDRICERFHVRADAVMTGTVPDGWTPGTNPWRVTLRKDRRQLTVAFYTGPAICSDPSPADVLSCLCSDVQAGEQSFENFCSDLGYDPDSRKAEATWRACKALAPRVRRFLGDDFDTFANASH